MSVPKTDPTGDFVTKVWPAYPKKGGFQFAQTAFVEAVTSGETTTEKVLAKIDEYKQFIALNQIQSGFVKGARSWFEGHGWMDEYDLAAPQKRPDTKDQPAQKETLPDWAQPGYTPEQEPTNEAASGLEDSLAGLRKLRQEHGV
ncbi:hypothetical protein FC07_GL002584 [Loigolactobacillus bifermentans DSM 20003]|uniref:Uncharacterized protein n=1 Tax=Loigolactobacillus bifermentans DSM 20003 TaxID=1423726 RepID=A0A0R1HA49_9LACO|nr:hypothetical protein FC07_GL002584 [Loigolactobacillus bifermentans DSM 20003]